MKFEKLKAGMVLYDRHKTIAGNTTMRVLGEWPVQILSVDAATRSAEVVWNGNSHRPATWYERRLAKLKDWSMWDEDRAERVEGMLGTIAVRKKRRVSGVKP